MNKSRFTDSQIVAVLKEGGCRGPGRAAGTKARHQHGDLLHLALENAAIKDILSRKL